MDRSHADEYRNKHIDYAAPLSDEEIAAGKHRRRVGGQWAVMGPLQRDFLVGHGLQPNHRLLDVGCGALRAGIHFVEYLEPARYYGIDINESLLDAGYVRELPERLRDKLPREHLRATDRFDCDFGVPFDYAIATSVFTHVSLSHVRLCLYRVGRQLAPGGRFYASYFHAPIGHPLDESLNDGRRWAERNALFHYGGDLVWAARCADLRVQLIGAWGHPGGQRMALFTHRLVRPRAFAERARRDLSPRLKRPIKRALGDRI
jgi:SAM-dependent methyltransferase